jgi:2'-5' RNA ligase
MYNLHRIFIAINLPQGLRQKLADFSLELPQLPANWTKPDNLHITLNFLGNANDEEVCDICQKTVEVAGRHAPFDVALDRILYGPANKFPPRMVWAVGEKSREIGSLQKDLESSLYDFCGAKFNENEDYGFSPHITLARLNQAGLRQMEGEEIPRIDEKINHIFMVESIEVMGSELKRGGPVYSVLESAKLGD